MVDDDGQVQVISPHLAAWWFKTMHMPTSIWPVRLHGTCNSVDSETIVSHASHTSKKLYFYCTAASGRAKMNTSTRLSDRHGTMFKDHSIVASSGATDNKRHWMLLGMGTPMRMKIAGSTAGGFCISTVIQVVASRL